MVYKQTAISGVYILEPKVFCDDRGYFYEVWKEH
ncbi:MAG: dTDP-4-dehydrorhamnose 3,5-epimerase family protein, partial [Prevotella sp.]|nr:dTDP-4-dehydrorhamnose 3,5-epimerase family protein [Prevotella sp.]